MPAERKGGRASTDHRVGNRKGTQRGCRTGFEAHAGGPEHGADSSVGDENVIFGHRGGS